MKKYFLPILLILAATPHLSIAQSSTFNMFGAVQSIFYNENKKLEFYDIADSLKNKFPTIDTTSSSFALQQMDIFFQNTFDENFSFFSDIEFKLNYSTEKNWGQMNIQEAWVNYSASDYFNVKFGMLFPEFNNLNSVKNRLNLMPYVIRPMVYEQILSKHFNFEDFIPEKAFLQISGFIPIHSYGIEYAAYMGNSEASFYSNNDNKNEINYLNGVDTKSLKYKLYGGRLGLKKADDKLKFGLSFTHDYDNESDTINIFGHKLPVIGNIPRMRLGVDISFDLYGLKVEHETIKVFYYDLKTDFFKLQNNNEDVRMGQFFTYTNFLYNFSDNIFAYFNFAQIQDRFKDLDGENFNFGGGYKLNSNITAKFQYMYYKETIEFPNQYGKRGEMINGDIKINNLSFGVSVNF